MQSLTNFIQEKLHISNYKEYSYIPKTKQELKEIVLKLIKERGKNADLNDIDVSNITDMSNLFENISFWKLGIKNIDISKWNVSNVEDMRRMFEGNSNLDVDLSLWDVRKVKNMRFMFNDCVSYKGKGLNNWKVESLEDMTNMFFHCHSLKEKPSWYDINKFK